jgi:hypothetical protein
MALPEIRLRENAAWHLVNAADAPTLTKQTWSTWSNHIHRVLKTGGAFTVVLGINPVTGTHYDPPNQNAALPFYNANAIDDWERCMDAAADWISVAAGEEHHSLTDIYLNHHDPRGMYQALEQRYAAPNTTTCFNALASLIDPAIVPNENWHTFLLRMKNLTSTTNRLRPANWTADDAIDMVETHAILKRIPKSHSLYTALVTNPILNADHVTEAIQRYLDADAGLPMETSSSPSTLTAARASDTKPGPSKTNAKCDFCYNKGHTIDVCRIMAGIREEYHKNKAANKAKNTNNRKQPAKANITTDTQDHDEGLLIETAGNASSLSLRSTPSDREANYWNPDSGASRHMTFRQDWIRGLVPD